jgi:hypothetical protein
VGENLKADYAALARAGSIGSFKLAPSGRFSITSPVIDMHTGEILPLMPNESVPFEDPHLYSLRQIGFEILSSPDLRSLAAPAS